MATFARIDGSSVVELRTLPPGITDISQIYHSSLLWAPCDAYPGIEPGWTANLQNGSWVFSAPPAPPPPSLPAQAAEMLAAGLHMTWTSLPNLSGTYSCSAEIQSHIQAELWAILLNGKFADGTDTVVWPDINNRPETNRTFPSADTFKVFATAVAAFVAGAAKVINGTSTTLPSADVTIP